MCTAAMQKNLPDFMTNLDGTSVTVPKDGVVTNSTDVPLGDAQSVDELSIKRRRAQIEEAQRQQKTNPGSHKPTGIRTRKDIMDEIT